MAFNTLPREIFQHIISCQAPGIENLRNYSLVCRDFGEVARAALWKDIDLTFDERGDEDANGKTERRQVQLLTSIALNADIGAHVRTFKNFHPWGIGCVLDATTERGTAKPEMPTKAAQNMKCLIKASFTENPLAIEVVTNLRSYSWLTELSITGINPEEHIWSSALTALKRLHWASPNLHGDQRSHTQIAEFLIKVVQSTCPDLESLDISLGHAASSISERTASSTDHYENIETPKFPALAKLRHLGLTYKDAYGDEQSELEVLILNHVARYSATLESVSLPVKDGTMTRETATFVLEVCAALPYLTEPSLVETNCTREGEQGTTGLEFLMELTSALASPTREIERLSITNIKEHYSPNIGRLFASWKSLNFLRLGDADMSTGPYANHGKLDFTSYRPEILGFITALPQSLQELYLEINGPDLFVDEDEFDPICDLSFTIFNSLEKLHTCDVHAWISNIDGGLGSIPEKAVFYRRLPLSSYLVGTPSKEIWTSRMDRIYQGSNTKVTKSMQVMDGHFEGEDAEEAWLGGYTNKGMEDEEEEEDYSWPRWVNRVNNYAMFRDTA